MAEPEEVVDKHKDYVSSQFFGQFEASGLEQGQGSLPHESMKTGSVSLTMGKWRRLPI